MSRSDRRSRIFAIAVSGLLTLAFAMPASAAKPSEPPGRTVDLQLLAFNDYHGHLEATTPGAAAGQPAGGGAYLATHLKQLAQGAQHSLTVAAGDLIGGSPFLSGLFHDEPSVESLNAMGLDVSSVGNHEFDEGVDELLRMQNGGCHPEDGCYFKEPYGGADFPWLAANVVSESTGETVLPPYWITQVENVKVGFIGMTLEATPTLVAQAGIVGWDFLDEADTANALVPVLKEQGVEAIVVLLHEGGNPADIGDLNSCIGVSGPIIGIQNRLDAEIDAVITGHTHQPYNCVMTDPAGQPRRVTSAFSFGRVISEVNLVIDRATGDVVRDAVTATNHLVDQTVRPDQNVMKVLEKWAPLADELGSVPVGEATAPITRAKTPSGSEDRGSESDLSNLIADAQLWATQPNGADIAFMNPGGVRADLDAGVITYAEAFNVQPFSNILMTFPMTGEQIISVLEEQCQPIGASRPFLHLGVPEGFTYDLARTIQEVPDPEEPTEMILACTAVSVSNVQLQGAALDPAATYMVTVNNFLADGGDNFDTFEEVDPALRIGGGIDLDEFVRYLTEFSPVSPPGTDRVNEL
ncbi:MAG TPA: bifunctional metallophosphatase/5'-nucleotidase [Candidatus Limnocylindria bacterium]|nr:bifunctional metallophosphatase/5'-nucleotidase [Candidatus Limnocylindria bacterium]